MVILVFQKISLEALRSYRGYSFVCRRGNQKTKSEKFSKGFAHLVPIPLLRQEYYLGFME